MQKLDPKAVWLIFTGFILRWFIFILVFGIYIAFMLLADSDKDTPAFGFLKWLWVVVPALLVFFWIWAKLTYHFYRYELREDGFRKEFGVIWKKYVTIPYDRIQNVDIYRGVIARILGLSDLNIQTAGASAQVSRYGTWGLGAEGRLPGLSREVAEQIRDELVKRSRQSRTTNQGL
ncbi:PH domain-containing protein [Patescibacteria group bacterium]|nr:PH domain-containing protein [Patescibacteria group bacterium]MBU2219106.1 PH domain-containing protein [Patescibacteria group bacterium]MBU2263551.1 PH domain-containing protein [Patescibacteria group bacterium]